jgi:pimeloyl-ACP methyl ester carboxylesterase
VDPRVFSVVGPDIRELLRSCRAPLHLAAGADDPMVSPAAMRSVDAAAQVIGSAGHNVHWERPAQVWDLVRASA